MRNKLVAKILLLKKRLFGKMKKVDDSKLYLGSIKGITYLLSALSIASIFVALARATEYKFDLCSIESIEFFFHFFSSYYSLYGATITLIIGYLAIRKHIYSRERDFLVETQKAIDSYYEKTIPAIQEIFTILEKEEIDLFGANYDYNEFTVQALKEVNPALNEQLMALSKTNQAHHNKIIIAIGHIESFASKMKAGLVNQDYAIEILGQTYCTQIESLYPIIAGYRGRNRGLNYFETQINLYHKWRASVYNLAPIEAVTPQRSEE